jgi:hypothetical protein
MMSIGRGGEGHAGEVFRWWGESRRPLWRCRQNFQFIRGVRHRGVHLYRGATKRGKKPIKRLSFPNSRSKIKIQHLSCKLIQPFELFFEGHIIQNDGMFAQPVQNLGF